jgi:hypothetical protein
MVMSLANVDTDLPQVTDCACGTLPPRPGGEHACACFVAGAAGKLHITQMERMEDVLPILRLPEVWEPTIADGGPAVDQVDWDSHWPGVLWLGVRDASEDLLGTFLCAPQGHGICEVHAYLGPSLRGRRALEASRKGVEHIWRYWSRINILTTRVPTFNRHALHHVVAVGFYYSATIPNVGRKQGIPYDSICLQVSRRQWKQQKSTRTNLWVAEEAEAVV